MQKTIRGSIFGYKDSFDEIRKIERVVIKEGKVQFPTKYTIAIPTYKRSSDLKTALDSVYNQITDIHFYVLVSDNNPDRDDETELLINHYYGEKENLTYIKNCENLGMAGNWNRLFLECKTEYLILFHDDDVLLPSFLSILDLVVRKYPDVSALNTAKYRWDGVKNIKYNSTEKEIKIIKHNQYTNFPYYVFDAPSGCLFNVKDVKKIGGFDMDTFPSIDYVLVQKLCLEQRLVMQCKNKLMLYRISANTSSKMETKTAWLDIDYRIKEELAELLNIPVFIKEIVEYFELKLRLRGISKVRTDYVYKRWSPGGIFFVFFFKLYRSAYYAIFVR